MFSLTVLGSGSRGNSIVLRNDSEAILLDAGFSLKETLRRMGESGIDPSALIGIVISHEHTDHISGLGPVFRRLKIPVYCNRSAGALIRDRASLADGALNVFATGNPFDLGGFRLSPFSIPHDALDPVGFAVETNGVKAGIATDLGHTSAVVAHHLRECDVLVVESNHDEEMLRNSNRRWSLKQRIAGRHGHLSNVASAELLEKIVDERTRHVVLAHASEECNRYELIQECGERCLDRLGRTDIQLAVARQADPLPPCELG